ncbi:MAG: hypothetical protein ABI983_03650 [Acidobacteriota bacterium]
MIRTRAALLVLLFSVLTCPPLAYAQAAAAAAAPELTVEQIKTFLKSAKVVHVTTTSKGVTAPRRLTLSDGVIKHDAVFQAIDDHQNVANLARGVGAGTTELRFVDSYKYNIAAYEVATLLGLEQMMPVYVERKWDGNTGSLSWFVTTLMDESDRLKKKIEPPSPADWNNQMYRMRVFSSLLRDTDRNLTNVLITPDWKVMMIDFSRAFRLQPELLHLKDLFKIDRKLLARMETLSPEAVKKATGNFLTQGEIDAMMQRRDLLVAHFKQLIATLGEDKVLY